MKLLAHIAATVLGLNLGILAAAVTAAYREHERHLTDAAWDAHVGDALAVAQSCTCDDWTAEELIALAPDLVELDGMETFQDFLYATGGDAQ
jgi:hypothetical protein